MAEPNNGHKNFIARWWRILWRPSARYSIAVLMVAGFAAGNIFWVGYNSAMDFSNTETFCISCHEMRANPFEELKKTVHYSNKSGVRAICSDCHVPKEWHHKFVRKIEATFKELPRHLIGVLDTPEKYEAKRLELATNVWVSMKATDSRECRNCHSAVSMKFAEQSRPARKKHQKMEKRGQTCIDCHQGIAHELPKNWEQAWESRWGG